jgi:ribosomal protein S1
MVVVLWHTNVKQGGSTIKLKVIRAHVDRRRVVKDERRVLDRGYGKLKDEL